MRPLIQQLPHHRLFPPIEWNLTIVSLIPIGHNQNSPRFEYAHELSSKLCLIRHVRSCLDRPDHIKTGIGERQCQRIIDLKVGIHLWGG